MTGYSVKISESTRQLTAKERIAYKDTTDAIKLDEACAVEALIITPADYVVLDVHNEKSDNVDYQQFVVVDKNGQKYVTGSNSFWNSFKDIFDEMATENEPYDLKIYKVPSKNYKGKEFITCSIL